MIERRERKNVPMIERRERKNVPMIERRERKNVPMIERRAKLSTWGESGTVKVHTEMPPKQANRSMQSVNENKNAFEVGKGLNDVFKVGEGENHADDADVDDSETFGVGEGENQDVEHTNDVTGTDKID
jgi:hypothetical protein